MSRRGTICVWRLPPPSSRREWPSPRRSWGRSSGGTECPRSCPLCVVPNRRQIWARTLNSGWRTLPTVTLHTTKQKWFFTWGESRMTLSYNSLSIHLAREQLFVEVGCSFYCYLTICNIFFCFLGLIKIALFHFITELPPFLAHLPDDEDQHTAV